jgi:6-phospho-beta-glucosidase
MRKVLMIGGGGVRTPLVIYALVKAHDLLQVGELVLFDIDAARAETMTRLGREIVREIGGAMRLRVSTDLAEAAAGSDFVLSSIRVGGIAGRARDERIAIEHGLAGQETTGPAGAAMALKNLPVMMQQARTVEQAAPGAWFINFTNPAGLMTQALTAHTGLRVIGICDTPIELFHRIADALGEPYREMVFDYAGLNHLGFVRRVTLRGADISARLLGDTELLRQIYPADLFDPALIQTLQLIPTEYLFFYYSQRKAHANQLRAGASRGQELERLNRDLFGRLAAEDDRTALQTYRQYLLRRNASYMKLEAQGESAFAVAEEHYDPFETATGYHRIALDVMTGLVSEAGNEVVVNVTNQGAIDDLAADDVVEVPCRISREGVRRRPTCRLPESVRGLVQSVKAFERTTIRAAFEGSGMQARLAMMEYPIIGQWELAGDLLAALLAADPQHLGYLR